MPQLDPSSFSSQLFWLTVSFMLLYVLMARIMLPRVQSTLAQRAQVLGSDKEMAGKMKADAELAREHYEKAITQASVRSQSLLAETYNAIAVKAQKRQAELDASIAVKLAEAQNQVEIATNKAKQSLNNVAVEVAQSITLAISGRKPDDAAVRNAVTALLKE